MAASKPAQKKPPRHLSEVAYQLVWSLAETARELGLDARTVERKVVRNDDWKAGSGEPYGWLPCLDTRIPVHRDVNGHMKVKAHEARRALGAA